ncbi:hypothetical protein DFH09DRAFT_1392491 [Mycena vulgaris]|nr:hypothetical protein DFH09DRAFT_1392491 [Mycena vulgaris]
MNPQDRLPNELWLEVFNHLPPDAFQNVWLTDQIFRALARPLIFADLTIVFGGEFEKVLQRLDYESPPNIAPFVRSCSVIPCRSGEPNWAWRSSEEEGGYFAADGAYALYPPSFISTSIHAASQPASILTPPHCLKHYGSPQSHCTSDRRPKSGFRTPLLSPEYLRELEIDHAFPPWRPQSPLIRHFGKASWVLGSSEITPGEENQKLKHWKTVCARSDERARIPFRKEREGIYADWQDNAERESSAFKGETFEGGELHAGSPSSVSSLDCIDAEACAISARSTKKADGNEDSWLETSIPVREGLSGKRARGRRPQDQKRGNEITRCAQPHSGRDWRPSVGLDHHVFEFCFLDRRGSFCGRLLSSLSYCVAPLLPGTSTLLDFAFLVFNLLLSEIFLRPSGHAWALHLVQLRAPLECSLEHNRRVYYIQF